MAAWEVESHASSRYVSLHCGIPGNQYTSVILLADKPCLGQVEFFGEAAKGVKMRSNKGDPVT